MNHDNYNDQISYQKKSAPTGEVLLINTAFQRLLTDIGLTTFDAVWSVEDGELIKQKKERSVIKIQLPISRAPQREASLAGKDSFFYIKKHSQRISLWHKFLTILCPGSHLPEGLKEFYHYINFRQKKLGTAIPVIAGMNFSSFLHVDSFLITQDFSPFIELEDYILNHPKTLEGEDNHKKKRRILKEIATYARTMHDSGMNQKDFNATHILLHNIDDDRPKVALFDLQRVDRNICNNYRWPIKALAELNYTLPQSLFSEEDRVFLFASYKMKETFSFLDRLQYRWIIKKTNRIARHSAKRGLAPKMTEVE